MQTVTPDVLEQYRNVWSTAPEDEDWQDTLARADAMFDALLACDDWQVSGLPPGYFVRLGHLVWGTALRWQGAPEVPPQEFVDGARCDVTVIEMLRQLGVDDATLWRWAEVALHPDYLGLAQSLVEFFDASWVQN